MKAIENNTAAVRVNHSYRLNRVVGDILSLFNDAYIIYKQNRKKEYKHIPTITLEIGLENSDYDFLTGLYVDNCKASSYVKVNDNYILGEYILSPLITFTRNQSSPLNTGGIFYFDYSDDEKIYKGKIERDYNIKKR